MSELVYRRLASKIVKPKEPYPTNREGVCLPPNEIDLPKFYLDPNNDPDHNNHHLYYYARMYEIQGRSRMEDLQRYVGCGVLFYVLRNLESSQIVMSSMQHKILHDRYSPPERPTVEQAMDIVTKAYEDGEDLRVGTADKFKNKEFNKLTMKSIKYEYNEYRRVI